MWRRSANTSECECRQPRPRGGEPCDQHSRRSSPPPSNPRSCLRGSLTSNSTVSRGSPIIIRARTRGLTWPKNGTLRKCTNLIMSPPPSATRHRAQRAAVRERRARALALAPRARASRALAPHATRNWPTSVRHWPKPAQTWSSSAQGARIRADVGRKQPQARSVWDELGLNRPTSEQRWCIPDPKLRDLGRSCQTLVEVWPKLVGSGPNLADDGVICPELVELAQLRPRCADFGGGSGTCKRRRRGSTRFAHTLACVPRNCATLVPECFHATAASNPPERPLCRFTLPPRLPPCLPLPHTLSVWKGWSSDNQNMVAESCGSPMFPLWPELPSRFSGRRRIKCSGFQSCSRAREQIFRLGNC